MIPGLSMLGMGVAPRLVMAAAVVILVWLMVAWAIA